VLHRRRHDFDLSVPAVCVVLLRLVGHGPSVSVPAPACEPVRPARLVLTRQIMDDWSRRVALAQRLQAAESELQRAVAAQDGSPAARTRCDRARLEYRLAEAAALAELGAGPGTLDTESFGSAA
ncbi:hypothetical protein K8625_42640, partial [Myxococcus sp. AS-1-15]|nr:hypothetical protein [Myxococcus sp. AS-1-15]